MKKKLFVLLMALLMVMTMMPTTAFAALNTGSLWCTGRIGKRTSITCNISIQICSYYNSSCIYSFKDI